MLGEEFVEEVVGGEVGPEGVEGLGQGQAGQSFQGEGLARQFAPSGVEVRDDKPGLSFQGEGLARRLRRRWQNHAGLSMSRRALLL